MNKLIAWGRAVGELIFLLIVTPFVLAAAAAAFIIADAPGRFRGKKPFPPDSPPSKSAVSVVIPTWQGRRHLERNLGSVVDALAGNPENEILIVDNASDDGTAEFLAGEYPSVRVLELGRNLGFGGGSNAGFSAAKNDIVVLLNNDMRVEPGFLQPLIDGFSDPRVFAVTAQIFFSDPQKRREETGLAMGRWANGRIHLTHVVDDKVDELFPTFYAGGGSSAYDRKKFLELGGFDEILEPFYMEDVDLSYMAWKRGWVTMYAPDSVVYHDHRGTIGKHFADEYVDSVVHKNHLLFVWKNIHEWGRLLGHFAWLYLGLWASFVLGPSPLRAHAGAFRLALRKLPNVFRRRAAARALSSISDREALRRPLGGYFRDRYHRFENKEVKDLNVLFVAPYPISPPLHGGGVFMNQTVDHLARECRLHLLCLLERESERESNQAFGERCTDAELLVRLPHQHDSLTSLRPYAAQHFWNTDLLWRIHRSILRNRIDVVQFEYTQMASYGGDFRQLATFLFEHDIYFQSVRRSILSSGITVGLRSTYEYLRALRFELSALTRFDAVQVCTREQRRYLRSFLGDRPPILAGLRAGIDVATYSYQPHRREPNTLLFVGNFRHTPNQQALRHFLESIFPRVRAERPKARLIVAGAEAPPAFARTLDRPGVEYLGEVDDIREALSKYAVFLAPVLTGSGVRVKILEAFAMGIPVVSTSLGAEGLRDSDLEVVEVADRAADFARAVVRLLEDRSYARQLAYNARQIVERNWDCAQITPKLAEHYRAILEAKLISRPTSPLPLK